MCGCAGFFCNSRACPASKVLREQFKVLNRPGHGTSFGKQSFKPFRRVPSKQGPPKDLFSISCLPSGLRQKRVRRNWRSIPIGRLILLRAVLSSTAMWGQPPSAVRRAQLDLSCRQLSCSQKFPMWKSSGNHLEILWEAIIDGIFAALYGCKVSRTVGFAFERFRLD
jgi:hypothetical protein